MYPPPPPHALHPQKEQVPRFYHNRYRETDGTKEPTMLENKILGYFPRPSRHLQHERVIISGLRCPSEKCEDDAKEPINNHGHWKEKPKKIPRKSRRPSRHLLDERGCTDVAPQNAVGRKTSKPIIPYTCRQRNKGTAPEKTNFCIIHSSRHKTRQKTNEKDMPSKTQNVRNNIKLPPPSPPKKKKTKKGASNKPIGDNGENLSGTHAPKPVV